MATVKYMYNERCKVIRKGINGNADERATRIYEYLYSEIWELVNNRDIFVKDKEHGVLYAKEFAQYVYKITGLYSVHHLVFWRKLLEKFRKGRLGKYCYVECITTHENSEFLNLRITPYIVVQVPNFSEVRSDLVFFDCNIVKLVFELRHVWGFGYKILPRENQQDIDINPGTHQPLSLKWKYYLRDLSHDPLRIRSRNDSYGCSYYDICFKKERHMRITMEYHRFNIELHMFLKYIQTIDEAMRRAFDGKCSLQYTAHIIKEALNGGLCNEYQSMNLEDFLGSDKMTKTIGEEDGS